MAIKKSLLEIVQSILSDMDSENVNSLGDTEEAQQVASIVEDVYYNIIATREIPEHYELIKLTALSDTDYPTHFEYPENLRRIDKLWYDVSTDGTYEYKKIEWCDPMDFLTRTDSRTQNYTSVSDKNAGTNLRIQNDAHPTFYTSFDDQYVIMDSHNATIDTTLTAGKVRAIGVLYPVFDRASDTYTPDLDGTMFPYLINESKSVAMSLLKGGSDPKIEQAARRQKSYIQNDLHKSKQPTRWSTYGR